MAIQFRKAERANVKAKIALLGPSGAGKTYTGLVFATLLAQGIPDGKVVVCDSENGRAQLYADTFEFDTITPDQFPMPWMHTPENYIAVIEAAIENGYAALVLDSLTHEWVGRGGILEIVDAERARSRNDFGAWNGPSQRHRKLLETIVAAPIHIVCTMRSEMDYVLEPGRNGGMVPRKVGLAPQQRKGVEYEFDLIFDLDSDGTAVVTKTRCSLLRGQVYKLPADGSIGHTDPIVTLTEWMKSGGKERELLVLPKDLLADAPPPVVHEDDEPPADDGHAYRCVARSARTKEQCAEIVYENRSYAATDGTPFLGSRLVERGMERWQKVYCYAHYTMKAKLEADKEEAERKVAAMKKEDAENEQPPAEKPKRPAKKTA